ncbi:MAG: Rpn family recombination-promoting nuclease/putative transposase [Planctomyces sp.]|nr:Rpn family recombination-promoting nuclease/putative transposase [Planctomyces sp.]
MKMLGVDPTVDFAFRKLFGDPRNSDILIDLLNSVLQPVVPITSVEVLNPFLDKAYADDKLSILDIKARDEAGRWINVEMQTTISSALRNRLVYYTSALYSSQLLEGESYATLTPAICICFLSRVTTLPRNQLKN